MNPIRSMASSKSPDFVLAAEFQDILHVWDLNTQSSAATMAANFDFGGERVAQSNDGQIIYCAAYQRYGVSAYNRADGSLIWNRRDLKKCQVVRIADDDTGIWCAFDDGPMQYLDRVDGRTILSLRGVRDICVSPYQPLRLQENKKHCELVRIGSEKVIKIPTETFAVLSMTFAPGFVIFSQAGGATRCLNVETGTEIWRRQEADSHCLQLGYSEADQAVLSIWRRLKGVCDYHFSALDVATGEEKVRALVTDSTDFTFCRNGQLLVCSNGDAMDTSTCKTNFSFLSQT